MSASSQVIAKKPMLSDSNYKVFKASATIILPAIGALYFALAQIWGIPDPEKVVGSIAALNTFVGVIVGLSKKSYYASGAQYAGEINVTDDGTKKTFLLDLSDKPETIETMDEVTFKVNRH